MIDVEGRICQLEESDRKLMEAIRDACADIAAGGYNS